MKNFTTEELVEELKKREGVKEFLVEPHSNYEISTATQDLKDSGPTRILVITD